MQSKLIGTLGAMMLVSIQAPATASGETPQTQSPSQFKSPPSGCVIETHNPHAAPQPHSPKAEAPEILNTVEHIVKAYSSGDLKSYEALLDNDCSYFDHEHNKMIAGKSHVVEYLKESFARHAENGAQPLLAYTIDQPYVKVLGPTAVVTYRAFEEIGGANPMHAEGLITKIFVKTQDGWKQQYDSSSWHSK